MNGRQQLIEQIRQQSIEKRAQALREAAQRQFSNAPITGAVLGGGRRAEAQCLPLGGVMLSVDLGDGTYSKTFLTESGTLNEQPQYLVLANSEGGGQFFVRISWTGSEWAIGQVFAINGTIDGENDFAFSPTLLSSAWSSEGPVTFATSPGEEFDCSWRHCFASIGAGGEFTLSLAAAWIGIPLTEAPNAYIADGGFEGFNIFWDEKGLGWIIEGPDEGNLSLLPGGTREQLPIGQFAIFDDLVLAISSSVCTFAPPVPPQPSQGFIFRVDTSLGDGNASFEIPTSGFYAYDYTATWTSVSGPPVTGTETGLTGTSTINFPFGGQYDIEITGLFPAMDGGVGVDQQKVTGIIQWGSNQWQSMLRMFYSCSNLSLYLVTDQPDLGGVTSMNQMFNGATVFDGDISGWDVSEVTSMDKMFDSATSFNRDLSGWCVSGISPQPPGFDAGATAWTLPRPNWGSPCLP